MKRPGFFTTVLSSDIQEICNEGNPLTGGYKTAWYCPDCYKLVVDLPDVLARTAFQKLQEESYRQMETHPQQDETTEDAP
jgi:hypothetical protein